DLETDLARDLPVEFPAGEVATRLAADMDCERRRGGVEELLGVVIGEDDPEVGLQGAQLLADVGGHFPHVLDVLLVFGLGHGEELRRMGQHGAADHRRHHDFSPWPIQMRANRLASGRVAAQKYRAKQRTTRQGFTAEKEASTLCRKLEFAPRCLAPIPSQRETTRSLQWLRCR